MRNAIPNAMHFVRSHALTVRRQTRALTLSGLTIVLGSVSACGGSDAVSPKSLAADQLYMGLRLSDHGINLALVAPYNTVQLQATPLAATGNALRGTGTVVYQALDSSVTVDTTGWVTALYTTAPGTVARVVAALQYGNITRQDTAYVQVTDTAPHHPLATFSIQPQPGGLDSAKSNAPVTIPVFALDAVGDTLLGVSVSRLVVAWSVSDASVAAIDQNGHLSSAASFGLSAGRVLVTARTNAYGTIMQDTLTFTIGYIGGLIDIESRTPRSSLTPVLFFTPSTLVIGVGTRVRFRTLFSTPIDVVFDDSTDVKGLGLGPAGNIPVLSDTVEEQVGTPGTAIRKFPVAGTYTYHSRRYGTSGTIIVSGGP